MNYYQFLNKVYVYYKKVGYQAGEESRVITFIVAGTILAVQITTIILLLLEMALGKKLATELLLTSWIAQLSNNLIVTSNLLVLYLSLCIIFLIGHLLYFKGKPFSEFLTLSFKDYMYIYIWGMGSIILIIFLLIP